MHRLNLSTLNQASLFNNESKIISFNQIDQNLIQNAHNSERIDLTTDIYNIIHIAGSWRAKIYSMLIIHQQYTGSIPKSIYNLLSKLDINIAKYVDYDLFNTSVNDIYNVIKNYDPISTYNSIEYDSYYLRFPIFYFDYNNNDNSLNKNIEEFKKMISTVNDLPQLGLFICNLLNNNTHRYSYLVNQILLIISEQDSINWLDLILISYQASEHNSTLKLNIINTIFGIIKAAPPKSQINSDFKSDAEYLISIMMQTLPHTENRTELITLLIIHCIKIENTFPDINEVHDLQISDISSILSALKDYNFLSTNEDGINFCATMIIYLLKQDSLIKQEYDDNDANTQKFIDLVKTITENILIQLNYQIEHILDIKLLWIAYKNANEILDILELWEFEDMPPFKNLIFNSTINSINQQINNLHNHLFGTEYGFLITPIISRLDQLINKLNKHFFNDMPSISQVSRIYNNLITKICEMAEATTSNHRATKLSTTLIQILTQNIIPINEENCSKINQIAESLFVNKPDTLIELITPKNITYLNDKLIRKAYLYIFDHKNLNPITLTLDNFTLELFLRELSRRKKTHIIVKIPKIVYFQSIENTAIAFEVHGTAKISDITIDMLERIMNELQITQITQINKTQIINIFETWIDQSYPENQDISLNKTLAKRTLAKIATADDKNINQIVALMPYIIDFINCNLPWNESFKELKDRIHEIIISLVDSAQAYPIDESNPSNSVSCTKGILERLISSIEGFIPELQLLSEFKAYTNTMLNIKFQKLTQEDNSQFTKDVLSYLIKNCNLPQVVKPSLLINPIIETFKASQIKSIENIIKDFYTNASNQPKILTQKTISLLTVQLSEDLISNLIEYCKDTLYPLLNETCKDYYDSFEHENEVIPYGFSNVYRALNQLSNNK